jgi:UDP-2,4-diacetamido-2,4,6-trideoxy-beta-L-altropyranose hydrolase
MRSECDLPHLLLRADADAARGAGHVMRCLALAETWHCHGGQVTFLSSHLNPALRQRIETLGIHLAEIPMPYPDSTDLRATITALENVSGESSELPWLVLDGYHFDTAYQSLVRAAGCRLMVIDDTAHLPRYDADTILNHAANGRHLAYTCSQDTMLLLGTQFALLRPEFQRWQVLERDCPEVARKIMVMLGDSDPDNTTLKIIQALEQIAVQDFEVKIVVGPLNPHVEELRRKTASSSLRVHLETNIEDGALLMAGADLAVAAAGTASCELAFMKVPALLFTLVENQSGVAEAIDEFGAARGLGFPRNVSREQLADAVSSLMHDRVERQRMIEKGRDLVDGKGVERVLRVMPHRASEEKLRLRAASQEDVLLLWHWANDSMIRRNSFNSEPTSWAAHKAWYAERIASPDTRFWILEYQRVPVGQIRYDRTDANKAQISLSIAPVYRGRSFGTQLLRLSADLAGRELGVRTVEGFTFVENRASSHAFIKAGFDVIEEKNIAGHSCFVFRRACLPLPVGDPCGAIH